MIVVCINGHEHCIPVRAHFMALQALGTSAGTVHIFELGAGASGSEWRKIQAHQGRITDICVDAVRSRTGGLVPIVTIILLECHADSNQPDTQCSALLDCFALQGGGFIGSCADDGSVVVSSVFSDESNKHSHHNVRSVRLAPDYARNQDRPFLTGGGAGHLWLVRRSPMAWLGGHVENKVHESLGEGPTRTIAWQGPLVAWANNQCVRVFDMERQIGVMYVPAPKPTDGSQPTPLDLCPPRLTFESDTCLLMAWGSKVTMVRIIEKMATMPRQQGGGGSNRNMDRNSRNPDAGGGNDDGDFVVVKKRSGEITAEFTVADSYIAGIAPFGEELALLCYSLAEAKGPNSDASSNAANAPPPNYVASVELRIVTRDNVGRTVYREVLPLKGVETVTPAQLTLACDPEHVTGHDGLPILIVSSPRDVVAAQPRGAGDHVEWLVSSGDYANAVAILTASPDVLPLERRKNIIGKYIKSLIDGGQVHKAAAACVQLLRRPVDGGNSRNGPWERDGVAWEGWLRYALETCNDEGKAHFAAVAVSESANRSSKSDKSTSLAPLRLSVDTYEAILSLFLRQGVVKGSDGSDSGAQQLLHAIRTLLCAPGETPPVTSSSSHSNGDGSATAGPDASAGPASAAAAGAEKGGKGVKNLFGKAFGALGRPLANLPGTVAGAVSAGGGASAGGGGDGKEGEGAKEFEGVSFARKAPHLLEQANADAEAAAAAAAEEERRERERVHTLYDLRRVTQMVQSAVRAAKDSGLPPLPATPSSSKRGRDQQQQAQEPVQVDPATIRYSTLLVCLAQLLHYDDQFEEIVRLFLDEAPYLLLHPTIGPGGKSRPLPTGITTPPSAAMASNRLALWPSPSIYLFDMLERHSLLSLVSERVMTLVGVDQAHALKLLCKHLDVFPPLDVAAQVRNKQAALLAYLAMLLEARREDYNSEALAPLHGIHLQLCGSLDRPSLLGFLQASNFYSLEEARRLCSSAKPSPLYRELVYVLSRMGNAKEAVALLMDRLHDVRGATELAAKVDDEEIWADLVSRAVKSGNGSLITELLEVVRGTPLNPVKIIQLVPVGVRIPSLAHRLRSVLHDRGLQTRMVGATNELMRRDFMGLISKLIGGQQGGLRVEGDAPCALCSDPVHVNKTARFADPDDKDGSGDKPPDGADSGDNKGDKKKEGAEAPAAADAKDKSTPSDNGAAESGGGGGGKTAAAAGEEDADDDTPAAVQTVVFFCRHAYHEHCLKEYMGKAAVAAAAARERERGRRDSRSSFSYGSGRRRTSSASFGHGGAYDDAVDRVTGGRGSGAFGRAGGRALPPRHSSAGAGGRRSSAVGGSVLDHSLNDDASDVGGSSVDHDHGAHYRHRQSESGSSSGGYTGHRPPLYRCPLCASSSDGDKSG